MKTTLLILTSMILFGCNFNKNDNCSHFMQLSGQYKHVANEGVVTWTGELEGSVDFSGVDYNDMTLSLIHI